MKNLFSGFYPPSTNQYERLWNEALIVLDTNVLLNLYRLPSTAKDELVNVLELLKERLWIPHQVALEFQRRRLTVISNERKLTEEALSSASELVADIRKKVDALQIEKRGLGIDTRPLLTDLEMANSQLIDAIKATHESLLDISSVDPIRQRLDDLLEGKVGAGPKTQQDLDKLIAGGDERYKERIPPGFADLEKEKNPNEASFVFDHLRYQRKYGDLVLWRQLVEHIKTNSVKTVLLITADRKEDWWWREQGKTIGPHPELIREIQREGGVELFWMYSSVQFVEHANKYSTAKVSKESVEEIQQVAQATSVPYIRLRDLLHAQAPLNYASVEDLASPWLSERPDPREGEMAVAQWLSRSGKHVELNAKGFPDFVVRSGEHTHGYEVKYVRHFDRMIISPAVVNSLLRGYMETREGRLSEFTLVILIPENDFFEIAQAEKTSSLSMRLAKLLKKYPIDSIIVGAIIDSSFQLLAEQTESDDDFSE